MDRTGLVLANKKLTQELAKTLDTYPNPTSADPPSLTYLYFLLKSFHDQLLSLCANQVNLSSLLTTLRTSVKELKTEAWTEGILERSLRGRNKGRFICWQSHLPVRFVVGKKITVRCGVVDDAGRSTDLPFPLVCELTAQVILDFAGGRGKRAYELDTLSWHSGLGMDGKVVFRGVGLPDMGVRGLRMTVNITVASAGELEVKPLVLEGIPLVRRACSSGS